MTNPVTDSTTEHVKNPQETVLVFAPHPDDEVLGVGGTIANLAAQGHRVVVCITSKGQARHFSPEQVETVRREAARAHELLGVSETHFLDQLPAAYLDTVPQAEVNGALAEVMQKVAPTTLFLPFLGDIHLDHQIIFNAAMVAARPNGATVPSRIYAYETLSETNWNAPLLTPGFLPTAFFDITGTLEVKLAAMRAYSSQLRDFPNERSLESITALAQLRGSTVNLRAAEAFVLVREVRRSSVN